MTLLEKEIAFDEGRENHGYFDTNHIWTGGTGHNIEAHGETAQYPIGNKSIIIPDAVIDLWFSKDVQMAIHVCKTIFPTFDSLSDNRQRILVNMAFDLMWGLKDWHHLQAAIAAQDWQAASMSIMDSTFAHQGPNRCARLAARMVEA